MIFAIFSYLCTDIRTNYYIGIRDLKGTIRPAVRSAGFLLTELPGTDINLIFDIKYN